MSDRERLPCPFCTDTVHEVIATLWGVKVMMCPLCPPRTLQTKFDKPAWVVNPESEQRILEAAAENSKP